MPLYVQLSDGVGERGRARWAGAVNLELTHGLGGHLRYTELYVRIWSSCTVILRHEDNF